MLDVQLRESRLRKAGIAGRARMASELRDMDEDVSSLSRTLAVRTLQLEMEYIFTCLEDEALDIAQDLKGAGYLLLRYVCMPVILAETSVAAKCVSLCVFVSMHHAAHRTNMLLMS